VPIGKSNQDPKVQSLLREPGAKSYGHLGLSLIPIHQSEVVVDTAKEPRQRSTNTRIDNIRFERLTLSGPASDHPFANESAVVQYQTRIRVPTQSGLAWIRAFGCYMGQDENVHEDVFPEMRGCAMWNQRHEVSSFFLYAPPNGSIWEDWCVALDVAELESEGFVILRLW
jgi:hypothetical protein